MTDQHQVAEADEKRKEKRSSLYWIIEKTTHPYKIITNDSYKTSLQKICLIVQFHLLIN